MSDFRFFASAFAVLTAAFLGEALVSAQAALVARATLNSCIDGRPAGTAVLSEAPSPEGIKNVMVSLSARNLPEGKHAVHIHEAGSCTPSCAAAGSHLDLGPFGNNTPVTANHPYHSGDLINVAAGPDGTGSMTHVTSRVSLSTGNLSLYDLNGASVVVHALPDTYCLDPNDPNCAGGGRLACGVIGPAAAVPTISALTATPNVIWPPNAEMIPVTVGVTVSDPADAAPVCQISGVTSNEPLNASDWLLTGPLSVALRAARSGSGAGRIYSIAVTCTNASQLGTSAVVTVSVPHDRR
jgi:Cu-Zn family superoxide dismutase